MFEAYSQSKKCVVNVSNEFNLEEVFGSPNPQCNAQCELLGNKLPSFLFQPLQLIFHLLEIKDKSYAMSTSVNLGSSYPI